MHALAKESSRSTTAAERGTHRRMRQAGATIVCVSATAPARAARPAQSATREKGRSEHRGTSLWGGTRPVCLRSALAFRTESNASDLRRKALGQGCTRDGGLLARRLRRRRLRKLERVRALNAHPDTDPKAGAALPSS
eukprot:133487-Prymnesium_polylepis.1